VLLEIERIVDKTDCPVHGPTGSDHWRISAINLARFTVAGSLGDGATLRGQKLTALLTRNASVAPTNADLSVTKPKSIKSAALAQFIRYSLIEKVSCSVNIEQ
jgi:hypothetical protein